MSKQLFKKQRMQFVVDFELIDSVGVPTDFGTEHGPPIGARTPLTAIKQAIIQLRRDDPDFMAYIDIGDQVHITVERVEDLK